MFTCWLLMSVMILSDQESVHLNIQVEDDMGQGVEGVSIRIMAYGNHSLFYIEEGVVTLADGVFSTTIDLPDLIADGVFFAEIERCPWEAFGEVGYEMGTKDYFISLSECSDTTGWPLDTCRAFIFPIYDFPGDLRLLAAVSGVPDFTYAWSTGDTTESIVAPDSGEVCVRITDGVGCVSEFCIDVSDLRDWVGPDSCFGHIVCDPSGDLVAMGYGEPDFTYVWSTGDTTESITPVDTGEYCVTITDAVGCVSEACTYVHGQDTTGFGILAGYLFLDSSSTAILESAEVEFYLERSGAFVRVATVSATRDLLTPFLFFEAPNLEYDNYIIKALPGSSNGKALNTYYGDTDVWDDAEILSYQGGLEFIGIQILEKSGLKNGGRAEMRGALVDKNGLTTNGTEGDEVPLAFVPVFLKDDFGDILEVVITNQRGEFVFSKLLEGTYILTFDQINVPSQEIKVSLSDGEKININWEVLKATTWVSDTYKVEVSVSPNPVCNSLFLRVDEGFVGGQLTVINPSGKQVLVQNIESSEQEVGVEWWPEGVYFLRVQNRDKIESLKVFKH